VDGSSLTTWNKPSAIWSQPCGVPSVPLSQCRAKGQLWAPTSQGQGHAGGEAAWVFPPARPGRPTLVCPTSPWPMCPMPALLQLSIPLPPGRAVPCCPYQLCVSSSLPPRASVNPAIPVGCSGCVRDPNPNPGPCPGLCQRRTERSGAQLTSEISLLAKCTRRRDNRWLGARGQ